MRVCPACPMEADVFHDVIVQLVTTFLVLNMIESPRCVVWLRKGPTPRSTKLSSTLPVWAKNPGFKSFWSARGTLAGIELMHMLKKGQMLAADGQKLSAAEQFYSLAA